MRRPLALAALVAAVALTAACQDQDTDGFVIVNNSATAVVVNIVDGTEVAVGSGHREVVTMDACLGTSVVVTAEGHPDVEMPGAACAGQVLSVQKDHSAYIKVFGG